MKNFKKKTTTINGFINKNILIKNSAAFLSIKAGRKKGTVDIAVSGLAVAFNGGGDVKEKDPEFKESYQAAKEIVKRGGIVISGGRNTGIMEAVSRGGGKYGLGINFPEQVKQGKASVYGHKLVTDPITRMIILTSCFPYVVVYCGAVGTLHEFMNGIIALKNHNLYGLPAPKILVHAFWKETINHLAKRGILDKGYLKQLHFFQSSLNVVKLLSK
ncbi:MAG: hypothetical protein COY66_02805 [Candidatus Kerfeldbacteria bacterium CG_4_10_14_0_8_um_filter_42_10]|uniref:Cytokinin riboside 5'-monophosphate phosphoribohydrolase n=1 Tax=Candidatus Kerfeldbacteria bacterium CG_4_10_14_0_8_um_filter_42_10 TaxID=2014248 RepID=A0A2M7RJS1_9BACT|nr:MAG: hypothetical protein COY66_02805 [Candidatus Kerfeldbacteria bacterium CG_4_10_14_0_8_um_filter_42_10]